MDVSALAYKLGSLDAIDSFVRANYIYRDETEEVVRTPAFMVNDLNRIGHLEGDCDDISTLYAALFKTLGYATRLVAIRYTPSNPNFEHVFTEAMDSGVFRIFDATVQPGTELRSIEEMIEVV